MKVVFLARYLPPEGSTTQMYTIAKGLIDLGHEIHIISAGPSDNAGAHRLFDEYLKFGGIHHRVRFPIKPDWNLIGKMKQLYQYIAVMPSVLSVMKSLNPDIIHVHYPVTSYLAKIYCIMSNKKFITTYHIAGIPKHLLHRKADYVIAISFDLKDELQYRYKYPKKRIRLIHNGISMKYYKNVNADEKKEIKTLMGLDDSLLTIGFVGSLDYRKGIDILLEAVSKISNINYQVILIGNGDIKWVESLIEKFYLKGKVSIYPFQDPIKFYKIFDIFVLPSRKEGFPLVAIEAMMMGVPIIRSNIEGAKDQIDHGKTGLIFENENIDELTKQISTLLKDDVLRRAIGRKGQLFAVERFADTKMINNLISLYIESIQ